MNIKIIKMVSKMATRNSLNLNFAQCRCKIAWKTSYKLLVKLNSIELFYLNGSGLYFIKDGSINVDLDRV